MISPYKVRSFGVQNDGENILVFQFIQNFLMGVLIAASRPGAVVGLYGGYV